MPRGVVPAPDPRHEGTVREESLPWLLSIRPWKSGTPPGHRTTRGEHHGQRLASAEHQESLLASTRFARDEAGPGQAVPFQAVSQTTLLGLKRRGRTNIKAMPDVFIFKKPVDGHRPSFHLRGDGPPAMAIEVGSDSTFDQDVDFEAGKGWILRRGRHRRVCDGRHQRVPAKIHRCRLGACTKGPTRSARSTPKASGGVSRCLSHRGARWHGGGL